LPVRGFEEIESGSFRAHCTTISQIGIKILNEKRSDVIMQRGMELREVTRGDGAHGGEGKQIY